jgi:hypothetical protein
VDFDSRPRQRSQRVAWGRSAKREDPRNRWRKNQTTPAGVAAIAFLQQAFAATPAGVEKNPRPMMMDLILDRGSGRSL